MTEEEIQNTKLKELLQYVAQNSPYYKRVFENRKLDLRQIKTVKDLKNIPFTTKEELQAYTNDFICVPRNELVDYVATSGTVGKPVTLALTDADLDRLALNESNSFATAGVKKGDVMQLMTTIDRRFMAGMAYFLGARKLGAGIIRVGNGIPELQWNTINELKPNVIICVPSFLLRLIEYAEQHHIDYRNSSVKKAICIGEAIRNSDFTLNTLGEKITQKWDIQLHSTYASSEMATAFTECEALNGGHLQADLVIAEIVDENGEPVKPGEPGELVVTTFGVEAMPLLRFKTGDICRAHTEPCACGRTSMRLGPVIGRKKQLIKYKGTSLYPNAIYDVLENCNGVVNYQIEVSTNNLGTDEITIHIGTDQESPVNDAELTDAFKAGLRVVPKFNFLSPEQVKALLLPEESRKPIKFKDLRINP